MNERVIVVGAGTMGAGIALVAASAGYQVDLVEPVPAARERARERIADAGIALLEALPQRSDAVIAIEAVPERIDLKHEIALSLQRVLSPGALIATNTSSLSVGEIAAVVDDPQRVAGIHFFNPPERMKLVEVVRAPQSSEEAIERAVAFVERIGKTAVVTADRPGFIVNRVARPFYLQSLRALDRGLASAEELDALARGAGFRMGPFTLIDLIGLDVNFATSESLYERTQAQRLEPVATQREMVARGLLGRKSGAGFYDYAGGVPEPLDLTLPDDAQTAFEERVAIVGCGGIADDLAERFEQLGVVCGRVENDDLLDEIDLEAGVVFDAGDGASDRGEIVAQLDTLLAPDTIVLVDAYATDLAAAAKRMRHPERLVGYGIVGSFESQRVVEIVDAQATGDDALEVAQAFFASLGKGVCLVEDVPALFLGRVIASIVNEAVIAVHEDVATPEDIDLAMRLGVNYPIGPIAWGREIGGARVARILARLAAVEGAAFGPHRSLWLLDVDDAEAGTQSSFESVATPLPGVF